MYCPITVHWAETGLYWSETHIVTNKIQHKVDTQFKFLSHGLDLN